MKTLKRIGLFPWWLLSALMGASEREGLVRLLKTIAND